jgi:hypothetical protein
MNKASRLKNFLIHLFLFPIALLLVFEEWGWIPLASFFNRLADTLALWKKIEQFISKLSPTFSFCFLLVPMLMLLPMKFLGLYFIDIGHVASGIAVFLFSKILGTAVFARIYTLTLPNLLKIKWFAKFYPRWIAWKNSLLIFVRSTWPWRMAHLLKIEITALLK